MIFSDEATVIWELWEWRMEREPRAVRLYHNDDLYAQQSASNPEEAAAIASEWLDAVMNLAVPEAWPDFV